MASVSAPTAMSHSSNELYHSSGEGASSLRFTNLEVESATVRSETGSVADEPFGEGNEEPPQFDDDEHVYANVQEMEEESKRKEQPPTPDVTEKPIRDLGNGWQEFLTETGRSYFFNGESGESHWKPPRFLKPPSMVSAAMNGSTGVMCDSAYGPIHEPADLHHGEDQVASCSAPASPLIPTKSLNDVLEGVGDHGISRTSLSVRNKVVEKMCARMSHRDHRDLSSRVDAFKSNEELAATRFLPSHFDAMIDSSSSEQNIFSRMPLSNLPHKSIKEGTLDKCKTSDAGTRLKKKEWASCYVFLSSEHIIFYKDEKSAEKSGRHYEAPLGMCDLRGATVKYLNEEKDKRRKHIFQLELIDGTVYQFSAVNSPDVSGWFHALRQVVSKLPRPDAFPTPVLERPTGEGVVRKSSSLSHSHSSSPFGTTQSRESTKKSKAAMRDALSASTTDEKTLLGSGAMVSEPPPTRESIIEKLRRFFRSRPTIESLKEKGIYRTEPVFGNTLAAICVHENTLVPRFIMIITSVIEAKGLDQDGLYRVSGNLSAIQRIRCLVDQDKYDQVVKEDDVHVLTGALKLFFRELAEPIFPIALAKDFIYANRLPNGDNKIKAFDELLRKLPLVNRETLKVLFVHLLRVAKHSDKNRMEIHNLAIMFGPSLFSSGIESGTGSGGSGTASGGGTEVKKSGTVKRKGADKKAKERPSGMQSNSHLAFNMIMQGQTVEFLLKEFKRFVSLQGPLADPML